MIEVGNKYTKIKNKDRWNYCHHMPMLPLLGENRCLPLLHMAKRFIWLEETKERINGFDIRYIINPGLNVNKSFRDQVKTFMLAKFGEITQLFIKATL